MFPVRFCLSEISHTSCPGSQRNTSHLTLYDPLNLMVSYTAYGIAPEFHPLMQIRDYPWSLQQFWTIMTDFSCLQECIKNPKFPNVLAPTVIFGIVASPSSPPLLTPTLWLHSCSQECSCFHHSQLHCCSYPHHHSHPWANTQCLCHSQIQSIPSLMT